MPLSLDEAIARIPAWASAQNLHTEPLSGGMTNRSYRVVVEGETFVLRISGANTTLLGLDRAREYTAMVAAARIGIAPEVVYCRPADGLLVTRFLPGRMWSSAELCHPAHLRRVADMFKRVHGLPPIGAPFSPWAAVHHMYHSVQRLGVALPRNFAWLLRQVHTLQGEATHAASRHCLCHNDVWTGNMLDDGTLRLVDWEFAGMGDLHFDLATLIVNHHLSPEHERLLLESYFGTVASEQTAQVKRMKHVMLLFDGLWALVQLGLAEQEHDFQAYADKDFAQLTRMLEQAFYAAAFVKPV
jgi:thiamine kinase